MSDLPPPPPPPPPSFPPMGAGGAPGGADVGSAFSWAWKKFRENAGALIVITIVVFVAQGLFGIIAQQVDTLIGQLIMQGLGFVLASIVQLGVVRAALMVTEGRTPSVGDVFKTDKLGAYIVASIIYGLSLTVGLIFCLVGIFVPLVLFAFYAYFVLDKGQDPIAALGSSFSLVKANLGKTLGVLIVAAVVALLGALACFVGLLVSIPVSQLMIAYTYKRLTNQPVAA